MFKVLTTGSGVCRWSPVRSYLPNVILKKRYVTKQNNQKCGITTIHSTTHQDSIPVDAPAPPSDDESFHSATEELDEPVGPPPTATNESTTVQSPHRMDQQETSEDAYKSFLWPEQSGRALLLNICTRVHFSLLCVLTCFISTVSSDGTTEVTTPPQTTPHPHDTLSGMAYNSYRTGS